MARNKHPEETVNLILDAASRLFLIRCEKNKEIENRLLIMLY